jgi:hypothetical protein
VGAVGAAGTDAATVVPTPVGPVGDQDPGAPADGDGPGVPVATLAPDGGIPIDGMELADGSFGHPIGTVDPGAAPIVAPDDGTATGDATTGDGTTIGPDGLPVADPAATGDPAPVGSAPDPNAPAADPTLTSIDDALAAALTAGAADVADEVVTAPVTTTTTALPDLLGLTATESAAPPAPLPDTSAADRAEAARQLSGPQAMAAAAYAQPATPAATAAVTATATHTLAAHTPAQLASGMVNVIRPLRLGAEGSYELALRLNPENLGTITIQVQLHGGRLHLQIAAAEDQASNLLRDALPQLQSELEGSGDFRSASYQLAGEDGGRGLGERGFGGDRGGPGGTGAGTPGQGQPSEADAELAAQRRAARARQVGGLDLQM